MEWGSNGMMEWEMNLATVLRNATQVRKSAKGRWRAEKG